MRVGRFTVTGLIPTSSTSGTTSSSSGDTRPSSDSTAGALAPDTEVLSIASCFTRPQGTQSVRVGRFTVTGLIPTSSSSGLGSDI